MFSSPYKDGQLQALACTDEVAAIRCIQDHASIPMTSIIMGYIDQERDLSKALANPTPNKPPA